MKIVHINTTDNRGGAAKMAHLLHEEINKRDGFSSHMLVREKNTLDSTVSRFAMTGPAKWMSILSSSDHTFLGGESLLKNKYLQAADIVHLHNLHGYYFHLPILKELVKAKKIVWTLHDMWVMTGHCGTSRDKEPNRDGLYSCRNRFEYLPIIWERSDALGKSKKKILENLDINYVVPSTWLKEKLNFSYLSGKKCHVIHNGFDTSIFNYQKNEKEKMRMELNLPVGCKIALVVSNNLNEGIKGLNALKGVLIDSAENNFFVVAVGEGKLPKHKNLIQVGKINNRKQLAKYYVATDIFLHLALYDNFPSVVCESLLCGTPVVAYSVGGISDQIRDGIDGVLCYAGDRSGYRDAIKHILSAQDFSSLDIARSAKERFSANKMVSEYLDLYNKIR
jgi:glycosyltransferase involved in cell wall biosynthesis